jgi:hypothetical protein
MYICDGWDIGQDMLVGRPLPCTGGDYRLTRGSQG